MKRLLTLAEVAELLSVPKGTIYRWRMMGQGPPGYRLGKHLRFAEEDLARWVRGRRDPEPPAVSNSLLELANGARARSRSPRSRGRDAG